MKIEVQRILLSNESTIGEMYIDGKHVADTLEDRVRAGEKVKNETAIPVGTYEVKLTYSPKFKKVMPEILNVPNFTGIRIHSGNSASDTSGCLLVGEWDGITPNWIANSKVTYNKVYDLLKTAADNDEQITITISNPV